MKGKNRGALLMLLCASMWSLSGILIKLIPWNALVISGFRSALAAMVVGVYMRAKGIRWTWNRKVRISGLFMGFTMLGFVAANKLTTSANAIVLQYTAPLFVMLISAIVYQQKYQKADVIVSLTVMAGMALFFFDSLTPGNLWGNILAILTGVSFGAMMVINNRMDQNENTSGLLTGHLIAAAVGIPFAFFTPMSLTPTSITAILLSGVVQLGIPYLLYSLAIQSCPPLAVSLISTVEPLLNPIWVFLYTGERPGLFALIGAGIILFSIGAWSLWNARAERLFS